MASDYQPVIKSLNEGFLGAYGQIVREIKMQEALFEEIQFIHENRRHNTHAHNLVRSNIYASIGRHVWLLRLPEGVCIPETIEVSQKKKFLPSSDRKSRLKSTVR